MKPRTMDLLCRRLNQLLDEAGAMLHNNEALLARSVKPLPREKLPGEPRKKRKRG